MNEAEVLFSEITNLSREKLYLNWDKPITAQQAEYLSSVIKRRINGQPIEYILGKTEFMGLEFKVSPDVLIPRPETEILVEETLKLASKNPKILDIGTGSGCIAVSLAKMLPLAKISAVDISPVCLKQASENAKMHNVEIDFIESDIFSCLSCESGKYDIIVSNPPYIRTGDIKRLEPEVKCQPRLALDGCEDGLYFYKKIIPSAGEFLESGGFLVLEIGFDQLSQIEDIFKKQNKLKIVKKVKDYQQYNRFVIAQG
ncbi:MAG: peptide chain release factor N(5)-glutamine methyltransferase [Candidatus Omnitrophica bacterium]|jgi:release factor glutamine methyltransferase|nr:peptide chain release factor N(5)-glutamine methyltransferase [Candidatus Omnitrophota bacterium]